MREYTCSRLTVASAVTSALHGNITDSPTVTSRITSAPTITKTSTV